MGVSVPFWRGMWFGCRGFWVFPLSRETAVQRSFENPPPSYDAQPLWGLADCGCADLDAAQKITADFLDAARRAAVAFHWKGFFTFGDIDWRTHAWKHIGHLDLLACSSWDPGLPADAEYDTAMKELLLNVEKKERLAIVTFNRLFPTDEEKYRIAKHYFPELADDWNTFGFWTPADLFEKYSETAVSFPDSEEGTEALEDLKYIASKRALKGADKGRGRPAEYLNKSVTRKVFQMSQALFLQMRQVYRLLEKADTSDNSDTRIRILTSFYPWIKQVGGRSNPLDSFLEDQPTNAAQDITGSIFDVSASQIDKTVYPL